MTAPLTEQKSGLLRALSVLTLVADHEPQTLGVSTIARELDMPKAVVHRFLKEFTTVGFLAFDEETKQYSLGSAALQMGLVALRSLDVSKVARPHLHQMVARTGETATLSMRTGWSRVYVDQVLSPHEIRMSISLGTSHPLHAGSSSKAILAHLSQPELGRYVREHGLAGVTASTLTDERRLRDDLALVQSRGYAVSLGERQPGAGSVAAPIRQASGEVFGSISLCGPQDRFEGERVDAHAAVVLETAALISAELGYRPPIEELTP